MKRVNLIKQFPTQGKYPIELGITTLGRSECDILLNTMEASRKHC